MVGVEGLGPEQRLRWSPGKVQVVEATYEPGMSVSLIARRHDVAAKLLFQWRKLYREGPPPSVYSGITKRPGVEEAMGK